MFVSSYNTYIQTNSSDKNTKQKVEEQNKASESFSSKLNSTISSLNYKTSNIPISYISQSQVLNNKNELEAQSRQLKEPKEKAKNEIKELINRYTSQNTLLNAKKSYEGNSRIFSLMKKPKVAFDQTPSLEKTLPQKPPEVKEIRELNMRHKMVNTYLANENYYTVTA